jgi:small subunit ribosomal protein S13
MLYLFESELPKNKSLLFALTSIFGLGNSKACVICQRLGFSKNLKVKDLSKDQVQNLITTIEHSNLILMDDLKKIKLLKFKKLLSIKSYKGLRLNQGLPVRGQRTHTNARTARKRK